LPGSAWPILADTPAGTAPPASASILHIDAILRRIFKVAAAIGAKYSRALALF
jgi:hypothetical protein